MDWPIKIRNLSRKSSIKREIFQSSALLALLVVAVFGFFLSTVLYIVESSKARAIMKGTNHAVVLFIEGYFTEITNTITVLDGNREIPEAMTLGEEARQRILDEYRALSGVSNNIAYIYSGYENGLMLINDYVPPEHFSPSARPWYQVAMASKPGVAIGLPYQDIKSKEWLISTSKAMKRSDGQYSGVITIDSSIEQLTHLIARHDEYATEFSFVMDKSGKIILHPDSSVLGNSPQKISEALAHAENGDFSYSINNVERWGYYSRIGSTGWTVVTSVDKNEVLRPVKSNVLLLIGLTSFIAVLLGAVQSAVLSRRLSRPLVELGKKIKATIAGEKRESDEYVYPDNEIGIMAQEIGQLAEKELNAKTRALQVSEEQHRMLIEHAVSAVASHKIVRDETGRPVDYVFLSANPAFETHTGLRVTDIIGRRATEVMPGAAQLPFIEIYGKVALTGESVSFEQYSEPLGRYYFTHAYRIGEECFVTIFIDISDRKRVEEIARESEETYKTILMASPDDITIADLSGKVILVSDSAHKMFGYRADEGLGMSVMDFIAPEDHERARANIAKMVHENYPGPNEYRAVRKDGSEFDIEVNNSLIRDRNGKPIRMVLIARDITDRKKAEQQIKDLMHKLEIERDLAQANSLTDSLTGLPNRRYIDLVLQTEFSRHKRSGSPLSLIMLDVDHFKKYNDHYGHLAGDHCLRQVAEAARIVVERASDTVARYGGEEFLVILPDTDSEGATGLAERIGKAVQELMLPHAASDTSAVVTISLGVASATDHALSNPAQLIALADQALYLAKGNGRNRYEYLPATTGIQ